MAAGEGDSNQLRFFELLFQEDLCLPQSWMEKPHRQRFTHVRPNGDKVQLDHMVTPVQWRNMVTDVKTVLGAALNSNHFLVKVQTNLRTKASKRKPPTPKRLRSATEEVVHAFSKKLSTPTPTPHSTVRPRHSPMTTRIPARNVHPKTSPPAPSTLPGQSHARLSSMRGPRRLRRKRRRPSIRGSPKPHRSSSSNADKAGLPRTRTLRHSFTRTSVHRPDGTKYSGSKIGWRKASKQWTPDKSGSGLNVSAPTTAPVQSPYTMHSASP